MRFTEQKIQEEFSKTLLGTVELNVWHNGFEADILNRVAPDAFIEYEIKITQEDFFADFFKENKGYHKHELIKSGMHVNQFWYICPFATIAPGIVPLYAGLIYVRRLWKVDKYVYDFIRVKLPGVPV